MTVRELRELLAGFSPARDEEPVILSADAEGNRKRPLDAYGDGAWDAGALDGCNPEDAGPQHVPCLILWPE